MRSTSARTSLSPSAIVGRPINAIFSMQLAMPINGIASATMEIARCANFITTSLIDDRALLDLRLAGLVFFARNSFSAVVVFELIHLLFRIALVAGPGRCGP